MPSHIHRFAALAAGLTALGLAAPAAAQTAGWVQCVARSAASGALYVGEASDGAQPGKAAQYRAEFIKAGRAAGGAAADVSPETAFCFVAPSQNDLTQMIAELGKAAPGAAAPYKASPVAWNIRDILPAELAASASHLTTLVMSEPPPPMVIPASAPAPAAPGDAAPPAEAAAPPPPPPPPHPLASARWRALLCGTDVRVAYAWEAPADTTVETTPFRGSISSPGGIQAQFDEVLDKTATAAPGCASARFIKVATLADFSKDLPPRGDARLGAIRQRLEDVTVQLAPPPPPPEPPPPPQQVAATPPAKGKAPAKPTAVATAAKPAPPPAAAPGPVVATAKPAPAPTAPVAVATAVAKPAPPSIAQPASPAVVRTAPPAQADGAQAQASATLNNEVARRNAEVDARNAAAAADYEKRMAAYKAAQDSYAAAQADYQRKSREHDAETTKAAEARAAWEAKVKACNAGDRTACAP